MYKSKGKALIKKGLLGASLVIGIHQSGAHQEAITDIARGRSEYVVMGEIGVPQFSALGAPIVKHLEHIDGRLVKLTAEQATELSDKGARVFRNRTDYRISSGSFKRPPCIPCEGDGSPVFPPPEIPAGTPTPVTPRGDTIPWGTQAVNSPQALQVTGGQNVTVCVLDTGLDSDHQEFKFQTIQGKGFVRGNGSWEDDQGHGTHVASTISASSDGQGMVGVSQARLAIGKVLASDGSGTSVAISEGIIWCTDVVGAQIISMSLGSPRRSGSDSLIRIATDYAISKGVIVIAAAGNDGLSTGCGFPAANPGVHCVSASDERGRMSTFSTHGSDVDYIAPGSNIMGARMGGGYINWDGTSMATPHVAAVWALALSKGRSGVKTRSLGLPQSQQGRGQVDALLSIK